MGGMKSGTGDVWGDDEDDESEPVEQTEDGQESQRDEDGGFPDAESGREPGERGSTGSRRSRDDEREKDIAESSLSDGLETSSSASSEGGSSGEQPYVVRRMLKDKSVQFERDERLTLFVHDDVKAGEQELEAETQELFGRDIPVFDIREAVYRAALRNREDVVEELEEMGYTRE